MAKIAEATSRVLRKAGGVSSVGWQAATGEIGVESLNVRQVRVAECVRKRREGDKE